MARKPPFGYSQFFPTRKTRSVIRRMRLRERRERRWLKGYKMTLAKLAARRTLGLKLSRRLKY